MSEHINRGLIVDCLEENNYWYNEYEENIDFGKYTPCGEDWFENLDWKSWRAFIEDLERRVNNWGVDEEVEVWLPLRGTRGVPSSISDLLEDAKWKQEQLADLLKQLKEVLV